MKVLIDILDWMLSATDLTLCLCLEVVVRLCVPPESCGAERHRGYAQNDDALWWWILCVWYTGEMNFQLYRMEIHSPPFVPEDWPVWTSKVLANGNFSRRLEEGGGWGQVTQFLARLPTGFPCTVCVVWLKGSSSPESLLQSRASHTISCEGPAYFSYFQLVTGWHFCK